MNKLKYNYRKTDKYSADCCLYCKFSKLTDKLNCEKQQNVEVENTYTCDKWRYQY